jgi:predicted fused transcriptional regulator/phosphomethylpyrimidine kinase
MVQIITKDKRVVCTTSVPYPPDIIKDMKKAGYKVKVIDDNKESNK